MSTNKTNSSSTRTILVLIIIVAIVVLATAGVAAMYLTDRESKTEATKTATTTKTEKQATVVNPTNLNDCTINKGKNYLVTIENSKVTPQNTDAKLCDTITFVNKDPYRLLTFGVHDQHVTYNGVTEKPLNSGESLTITLDAEGTIPFHDHDQDEVEGVFTVTKN